jgi:undecaprenyl-diphosphatase
LLLLFAAIASAVSLNATASFDRGIILSLRDASNLSRPIGPGWAAEAIRDVTSLGSVVVVFLFVAVVCGYWLFAGNRRAAALLLVSTVGALLLNDVLKLLFDRPRPDAILQAARVFSSGFPSGHATLSCATYFSAALLFGSQTGSPNGRVYLLWAAAAIIAAIGFSRIYLGLHYPTDVFAGWCIGGAWVVSWAPMFEKPQRADANP